MDFANTVSWHASSHPEDSLSTYRDLVLWATTVSIVSPDVADDLVAECENDPTTAKIVLEQSKELREAIYRIFARRSNDAEAGEGDMRILNSAITRMMANFRLKWEDGSFVWDWTVSAEHLESVLWPVVLSAVELLTSDAIERVGQCADERGCGWLFWDNSRNRTRRWCDMRDCGNLAKAKRHYRKSHGTPKP